MSSEPSRDAGALRIKRKLPRPFPYSSRYPEPDPTNPFAPLSVLRGRTTTFTNSPYESPVTIPDQTPASPRVLDLPTFITHSRKKSAGFGFPSGERGWQGHASQLRKGVSMGVGLNGYSPGKEVPSAATIASTTLRPGAKEMQRHEARRRSQSVFALRSGTFSFLESRAEPEPRSQVESSTRRRSLSPYDSRASILTSSSTSLGGSTSRERKASEASARPLSCGSSFVSATLLDDVAEHFDDAVPLRKSMHFMQVDMPATQGTDKRSETPPHILPPPPLEKPSPSISSVSSWSRDLAFYSASSRPQTPSSIRSSRRVSLPSSAVLSFPLVPVNLPPAKSALFTTSPVTSSKPHATSIPSTVATSLPSDISSSNKVSTLPENPDALPIQLGFRFPKQEQSVKSGHESVERDNWRLSRLRARKSAPLPVQRSSTSSSLRSTLRAAAEAAERLAAEDASSIATPAAVTWPLQITQAPVTVSENTKTTTLTTVNPESKELEKRHNVNPQVGSPGCSAERPDLASSITRGSSQENTDGASVVSSMHTAEDFAPRGPPKPEAKANLDLPSPPKERSVSQGPRKATATRSSSTPLPLSRPLPSPPTITTHPEPVVMLSPTPHQACAHDDEPSPPQVRSLPLATTVSTHAASQPTSHVVHGASSTTPNISLPAGAAPPRVGRAPTVPFPHTTHTMPSSLQIGRLPPPPPPPRSVLPPVVPSRTPSPASNVIRSTSSSSSHADNMSTLSAPQLRRRNISPSSSHGRHSPHTSERHGHHSHPHPYHHTHRRSISEPGAAGTLSSTQLTQAARLPIVRENGLRIQFGELWRIQRTVVIFIRHFWCPMCQDYLASVMREVDHAALARSGVRLVVIGCGSYGLIRSYRQIFHLPYELFVDASPGQMLYRTLRMGQVSSGAHKAHPVGSYVRHGAVSGLAMVVAHALRVGMPVWERGGDASQLGGEFVLGPGLSCTYAHRMQSTAGHAPILDVLAAAGVRAARRGPGAGPGAVAGRPNISPPLKYGVGGRDAKVLSVVREEACGACGACEICAEALNIDLESTASGEWSIVLTGQAV